MTLTVPHSHWLIVACLLFTIGLWGLLARRSLIFVLISLEIMVSGVGLVFVTAASRWGGWEGPLMYFSLLAIAAVEVGIALAILTRIATRSLGLSADDLTLLKDKRS